MSMSDDVQRAGAPSEEGTGLKNPYASGGSGQNAGKPATGLPGLAAFGQMQSYTPQTAQPEQLQQPQQGAPEPEQQFTTPPPQPAEPAPQAAYEEPPYDAEAFHAQTYSPEQDIPPDQADQQPQAYDHTPDFVTEPEQQDFAQAQGDAGNGAGGDPYTYPADGQAQAEDGQPQGLSFSDLTDAYRDGMNGSGEGAEAYEFTADDLQSYMASNPQGAHDDPELDAEENFDASQHMALQPFEARYDQQQRPVNLAGYDDASEEQPFFDPEQQDDADFLGGDAAEEQMPPPRERKSRRALMFASGLVGALALGGALAFAYKMTGETQVADGSAPPLIKADDSPVKVAPEEPGGKQFAHQNKQIYDRLQGDQPPEVERIVPRQEPVPETPPAAANPGAAVAAPNPGGPHTVRTLKVMPDGSVVVSAPPAESTAAPSAPAQQAPAQQPMAMPMQAAQPTIPALPAPGSGMAGVAVTMPSEPQPQQVDQTTVASVPASQQQGAVAAQPAQQQQLSSDTTPAPIPQPKPAAPARQTASVAASQPAQASAGSGYVVQVASRRSQAMALAAFADLQQKYTSLLGDYQPMIQSADLGDKGVWYRLRVGPIGQKSAANDLCNSLKKAGLRSCLVRPL